MECLRSSQNASSTSCSLRCMVRSCGQEQVLGELLGQRRAALRHAAMHDVGHGGARDADRIDAVMRIEPAILDGDERLRQIGRQILQRHIGAGLFAARGQHACRRCRRSGWSAAASEFPATGSAADARRHRPRRRRRRSRPTGRAPRSSRTFFGRTRRPANCRAPCWTFAACAGLRPCARACRRRRSLTRSSGFMRSSDSDADTPNTGSLRPLCFFAIARPARCANLPVPGLKRR